MNKITKRRRAIVYARSATGQDNALARQIEACRAFARECGYTVIGEYSEVISGVSARMPKQAQALAQAMVNGAVLICANPERLSRDHAKLVRTLTTCRRRGVAGMFAEGELIG